MNQAHNSARNAIETRNFIGWRGLPSGCTPDTLFDVSLDEHWGELQLGKRFEPAKTRLLDTNGYYRPMVYVRDGVVVMFDGMNPALANSWDKLSEDLGTPEAKLDWVHGTVPMPHGERVYASRGITIFLNPENNFVIYVAVYVPTTVEGYVERLRQKREKRSFH